MIRLIAVLLAISIGGCAALTRESFEFDRADLNDNRGLLRRLADEADFVVAAEIVSVGAPPNAWAGVISTHQAVRYRVRKVYKGQMPSADVVISHIVVSGSRLADKNAPGLDPAFFAPGRSLVLFLKTGAAGDLFSTHESYGALPYSAKNDIATELAL